ncbi:MAG TPA: alpha/beta hydrolase [Ktedonobacteraceae bacterium]
MRNRTSLFIFHLFTALGLVVSACGGTSPIPSHGASSPDGTHPPTATLPPMHSMSVNIGGYRLYVRCMGLGTPTVIFEAGLGEDLSTWDQVLPQVSRFSQACAYDRANVAPSDERPAAIQVSAPQIAGELQQLMVNAHLPEPYVLVGHSLGGLFMQMFACQYPRQVAGMVLVDSTHPQQAMRLAAALGPTFSSEASQGFPVERITYNDILAMQAQVDAVRGRFPQVPLLVLVRSRFTSSAHWTATQYKQAWMNLQTDLSRRSSRGKLVVAQNSGHFIQNDRPDLVIASIREIVQETQHATSS